MSETIELLTLDEDGRAVEGMKVPVDRGGAIQYLKEDYQGESSVRLAYLHKFFRYDEDGEPMPDTLTKFFVPDWMCRDGSPGYVALAAVEERMGWSE